MLERSQKQPLSLNKINIRIKYKYLFSFSTIYEKNSYLEEFILRHNTIVTQKHIFIHSKSQICDECNYILLNNGMPKIQKTKTSSKSQTRLRRLSKIISIAWIT